MRGNNTLQLNEATLKEALQEYLEKRMGAYAPIVGSVRMGSDNHTRDFLVDVSEREKGA